MNSNSEQQDNFILERMKTIGSTVFADVVDHNNAMDYNIKPVNFKEPLAGRIRTVSLPPGHNLFLHHAIYEAAAGEILVVDGKGYTKAAYLGDLMASAAQQVGLKGIVVDGFVRDKRDLQSLDIQVYAKGFIPEGPGKEGPGSFDEPISCGGIVVSPYDYLVADEDGVVIIPQGIVEQTLEKAEKKLEYERSRRNKINSYSTKEHDTADSIKPNWLDEKIKKYL